MSERRPYTGAPVADWTVGERAYWQRCIGLSWSEIGQRLGVSANNALQQSKRYALGDGQRWPAPSPPWLGGDDG